METEKDYSLDREENQFRNASREKWIEEYSLPSVRKMHELAGSCIEAAHLLSNEPLNTEQRIELTREGTHLSEMLQTISHDSDDYYKVMEQADKCRKILTDVEKEPYEFPTEFQELQFEDVLDGINKAKPGVRIRTKLDINEDFEFYIDVHKMNDGLIKVSVDPWAYNNPVERMEMFSEIIEEKFRVLKYSDEPQGKYHYKSYDYLVQSPYFSKPGVLNEHHHDGLSYANPPLDFHFRVLVTPEEFKKIWLKFEEAKIKYKDLKSRPNG